jgi:transposase
MRSWSSIGSGRSVCRIRAKGRRGGTSYKRWCRQWFEQSAMGDLLHADCVGIDTLYRCLDKLLEHKTALFDHLRQRWQDLFGASFEVLLYDLTSTYFESSQLDDENEKRCYGYSRDKRNDCVQVVIALIVRVTL